MSVLIVPELDAKPWPTLGPQVCDFVEAYLVHGPGDLREQPATIDAEKRAFFFRAYEVFPVCRGGVYRADPGRWFCKVHDGGYKSGTCPTTRRRFDRVAISELKGSAKTEFAAWIGAAELDVEGPVRCDGFDSDGNPVGRSVIDPYIPMVAYTEEQSEDLAFGALHAILLHSKIVHHFDIGLGRIMRIKGDGQAKALASAPSSRDGALTSFQHFDETHRLTLQRLKDAHTTMLANIPKRYDADAWTLETTTAYAPGEGSIAEETMEYARDVNEGRIKDSRLFYYHRQAGDHHDLKTPDGRRDAFMESAGPLLERYDIAKVIGQWESPKANTNYLERTWLNRPTQGSSAAFSVDAWTARARPRHVVPDRAWITIGFDGSRRLDASALVATEVPTGFQWPLLIMERPHAAPPDWLMPAVPFSQALAEAFRRFNVWKVYADPPYWETVIDDWAGLYGEERVVRWFTNRWAKMAYAVRAYDNAMKDAAAEAAPPRADEPIVVEASSAQSKQEDPGAAHHDLCHSGDETLTRHIGNTRRYELSILDENREKLWVVRKERQDSPNKIDGAVAGVLSWEARRDALREGIGREQPSAYLERMAQRTAAISGLDEEPPELIDAW